MGRVLTTAPARSTRRERCRSRSIWKAVARKSPKPIPEVPEAAGTSKEWASVEEPTVLKDAAPPTSRRLQWWGRGVACLVLAASCGATYWMGYVSQHGEAIQTDGLVIADQDLSFGTVWEQDAFRHTLSLKNTSPNNVEIVKFAASCNCARVEPQSLVIPAGQTRKVQVKLDLTQEKWCGQGVEAPVREFTVHLSPLLRDRRVFQTQWTLRGRVRRVFQLPPRATMIAPEPFVRGEPFASHCIVIPARVPLKSVVAECNPADASVSVARLDSKEENWNVVVTPSEQLPVGPFTFEVVLRAMGKAGKQLPASRLRVKGQVEDEVRAIPRELLLGALPVGTSAEAVVSLRSRKGQGFEIEGIETVAGTSVRPRSDRLSRNTFALVQQIAKQGNQTARVRLTVRTAKGKRIVLALPIVYYGLGGG